MSTPFSRLQSFNRFKSKAHCNEKAIAQQLGASCVHECYEAMRTHMPDNATLAQACKSDKGYASAAVRAKAMKELFAQAPAEVARVHEELQVSANREGVKLGEQNQQLIQHNQQLCHECAQLEQQSTQKDKVIGDQKEAMAEKDGAFECLLCEHRELKKALDTCHEAIKRLDNIGHSGPEN